MTEFLRFLYLAVGGLRELESDLHLSRQLGYLSETDPQHRGALADETARILTGFMRLKEVKDSE